MISDARGGHVSPGIYTEEKDVTYSVKSLGITSLGLVGETLYGPAFENVEIENWSEFVDYFGGTSTEKFKGTGLPKYELPYIAKSYLEESKRLNVVRVLGLSGYHAGPYWVVKDGDKPVVILRSKMSYGLTTDECGIPTEGEPVPVIDVLSGDTYENIVYDALCREVGKSTSFKSNAHFAIRITCKEGSGYNKEYKYNLSLDPSDSNYIYNVLSNRPDTGTTPVYVESVFEGSFSNTEILKVEKGSEENVVEDAYFVYRLMKGNSESGYTYQLTQVKQNGNMNKDNTFDTETTYKKSNGGYKYNSNDLIDSKYKYFKAKLETEKYDEYLEGYRAAQTPWIVSDAIVSSDSSSVRKLFKFITISDGDAANYQVKVSIQNIKPEEGVFDVVVRDFNDSDAAPMILEKFSRCNLVEGDVNYIAYKIGTSDGGFVSKSKYILVEMADGEDLRNCIPAGFLGYPVPKYNTTEGIDIVYNKNYMPNVKAKKQYFGFSDLSGIEVDIFSYKGVYAYSNGGDVDQEKLTNGFHMDSAISGETSVDGVPGYKFTTVSSEKVGSEIYAPRLVNFREFTENSIYKDVNVRKFTVCFYGGFDGWDVNRESRTNTDNYKASKLTPDAKRVFSAVKDSDLNMPLNLPSTAITSDYYAYLAGYRVFANPQDIDINVFATPGIDWYNNTLLTEEAIDMIEDADDGRGGDALYVMASPMDMDASELAQSFADSNINSSYACTYGPWVMYYDTSNKRYINLPVTKDVVRNMAATDNNSYPWFAPAGIERGNVNCVKALYKTTLADEDDLYENRVNPVKTFAQDGVKIWGNKTAYDVDSPLNRINVRRLMIRVKKLVTNAAKHLIFTQYDNTLEQQFRGLVDPILADVKANRGISDYRIMTEVTPETRDQHILPAKILIKPTPSLEYISISFVVYPESVSFDNE